MTIPVDCNQTKQTKTTLAQGSKHYEPYIKASTVYKQISEQMKLSRMVEERFQTGEGCNIKCLCSQLYQIWTYFRLQPLVDTQQYSSVPNFLTWNFTTEL